jgi:hypothetical protein
MHPSTREKCPKFLKQQKTKSNLDLLYTNPRSTDKILKGKNTENY